MIYLFTGNSRYLIQAEVQKWKSAFIEKYDESEVIHIKSFDNIQSSFISWALQSPSLFYEKRLVIIEGFPFTSEKINSQNWEIESTIMHTLPKIPDFIITVFVCVSPDKRKSTYKELQKIAELKEFNTNDEATVKQILINKYTDTIERRALEKLLSLKWWNLEKCIQEIEKLSILHSNIQLHHVLDFVSPEFEESIFVLIDSLLMKHKEKSLSEMRNILSNTNFYAFYQSLIVNIRVFLYISFLKQEWKSVAAITDILNLWKRSFLINKNIKASYKDIQSLYEWLLKLDKNMKFWRLPSSDEKDLIKILERNVLNFLV